MKEMIAITDGNDLDKEFEDIRKSFQHIVEQEPAIVPILVDAILSFRRESSVEGLNRKS